MLAVADKATGYSRPAIRKTRHGGGKHAHKHAWSPLPPTAPCTHSRISASNMYLRRQLSLYAQTHKRSADGANLVGVVPLRVVFNVKHQSVRDKEFQTRLVASGDAVGLKRNRRRRRGRGRASRSGLPAGARSRFRYRQKLWRKRNQEQDTTSGTCASQDRVRANNAEWPSSRGPEGFGSRGHRFVSFKGSALIEKMWTTDQIIARCEISSPRSPEVPQASLMHVLNTSRRCTLV